MATSADRPQTRLEQIEQALPTLLGELEFESSIQQGTPTWTDLETTASVSGTTPKSALRVTVVDEDFDGISTMKIAARVVKHEAYSNEKMTMEDGTDEDGRVFVEFVCTQ